MIKSFIPVFIISILAASASSQVNPPVWNGTASYKVGDVVTYAPNGCVFRAIANQTTFHPNPSNYLFWELYSVNIAAPFVLTVGKTSQFPSLAKAWNYIKDAQIGNQSHVQIKIVSNGLPFLDPLPAGFSLNHAFGSQISILGDNPNKILLVAPQDSDGFDLSGNHTFGQVSNVQIGSAVASTTGGTAGLYVSGNSSISLDHVTLGGFDSELVADRGSISLGAGMILSSGSTAVSARNNSSIIWVDQNPVTINGFLVGIFCQSGSNVRFPPVSSIVNVSGSAIEAFAHGYVSAPGCNISNVGGDGVRAAQGALVDVGYASMANIGTHGSNHVSFRAFTNGTIIASGATGDTSADASGQIGTSTYLPGFIEVAY